MLVFIRGEFIHESTKVGENTLVKTVPFAVHIGQILSLDPVEFNPYQEFHQMWVNGNAF